MPNCEICGGPISTLGEPYLMIEDRWCNTGGSIKCYHKRCYERRLQTADDNITFTS